MTSSCGHQVRPHGGSTVSWGSKDKDGLKCGAGKKRSFQVGAIEWVGQPWRKRENRSGLGTLHGSIGWNQEMRKGVKATRLCGKVMVTP